MFCCDPAMIKDERFILGYTKVHLQLVTNWHEAKKLMCKEPILLNFDRNCPEKKFNLRVNEIEKKPFSFRHINYCIKFVDMLLSHNIKPILVFDGRHLPAKADTEAKRRE